MKVDYIWYSEEGPGQAAAPPSPLLAVPNVTAHPLTASVLVTVLLYDGPLFCSFNVAIKGLKLNGELCNNHGASGKLSHMVEPLTAKLMLFYCHPSS